MSCRYKQDNVRLGRSSGDYSEDHMKVPSSNILITAPIVVKPLQEVVNNNRFILKSNIFQPMDVKNITFRCKI